MDTYILEREQVLDSQLDAVWDYFSSPENLDELTPSNMGFEILSKRPLARMYEGQEIEYKVRPVLNIPIYWKTRITEVKDQKYFIDEQLKGPYKLWKHKHTFSEEDGKVLMKDKVEYMLPFSLLGNITHSLYVKARLQEIFDYRYNKVNEIFN